MSNNSMKQESFHISDEIRKKIIRQDRVPVPPKKCYLAIDEMKIEILNLSNFGVGTLVMEQQIADLNKYCEKDVLKNGSILYDNVETQKVRIKLARLERHPDSVFNDFIGGFDVIGDSILVDRIKALILTDETIRDHRQSLTTELESVPAEFKLMVYQMRDWLNSLKSKVDILEKSTPVDNADEHSEYRETVAERIAEYVGQVVPTTYQNIPMMMAGKDEKTIKACTKFIRNQIGDLIYGAPFAYRAYNKPRGYAGDYEMMNHLYRNELVGSNLFNQCMHKYFIDEPAGQAVKNRGYYLLDKIKETIIKSSKSKIRILAVASGPAMEQQLFLKEFTHLKDRCTGKTIEFISIDQDEESLKHAQHQLLSLNRIVRSDCSFRFMNLAIKNIIHQGLPEGDFDLIYSAGLFDYFTDPVAQLAANKLFDGLNNGGHLIIGNYSTNNPTRPLMEMVLEWHLIYRTPDDLKRLFGNLSKEVIIEQEKLGINLFAVIKK